MGTIIRPAAFERPRPPAMAPMSLPVPLKRPSVTRSDRRLMALLLALATLSFIFALAGAAFAVRIVAVLCLALLAGRGRRVDPHAFATPWKTTRLTR
jgi:hypothetical protein